jgi:hypothetical protein
MSKPVEAASSSSGTAEEAQTPMQEAMARFKGGLGNFQTLIDDLMSAVQKASVEWWQSLVADMWA